MNVNGYFVSCNWTKLWFLSRWCVASNWIFPSLDLAAAKRVVGFIHDMIYYHLYLWWIFIFKFEMLIADDSSSAVCYSRWKSKFHFPYLLCSWDYLFKPVEFTGFVFYAVDCRREKTKKKKKKKRKKVSKFFIRILRQIMKDKSIMRTTGVENRNRRVTFHVDFSWGFVYSNRCNWQNIFCTVKWNSKKEKKKMTCF